MAKMAMPLQTETLPLLLEFNLERFDVPHTAHLVVDNPETGVLG